MATVIGLASGTQFVVCDKSYVFTSGTTGLTTRVFLSEDKKRVITIPPDGLIEFFDEPASDNVIDDLEKTINHIQTKVKPSKNNDPNIG